MVDSDGHGDLRGRKKEERLGLAACQMKERSRVHSSLLASSSGRRVRAQARGMDAGAEQLAGLTFSTGTASRGRRGGRRPGWETERTVALSWSLGMVGSWGVARHARWRGAELWRGAGDRWAHCLPGG